MACSSSVVKRAKIYVTKIPVVCVNRLMENFLINMINALADTNENTTTTTNNDHRHHPKTISAHLTLGCFTVEKSNSTNQW